MDKCVLIVDDNDFNRELVKDILEDEDITVYEAEDGSSAIELLESEQSISGKAHFLVRKLKSTGWILIETENDFREYITVPGFSYKIIQLLYDVANVSETENFAYVTQLILLWRLLKKLVIRLK